jgi:hypothetical protein
VSGVLVTDAECSLKSFHLGMEKMVFAFGVALALIGIRQNMNSNGLTGSTLASTNPPAISVLYNFLVTPG